MLSRFGDGCCAGYRPCWLRPLWWCCVLCGTTSRCREV